MRLKELEKGCSFKAFGYEWIVLEKNDDFCFCICDELVAEMPFRKYYRNEKNTKTYKVAPNDFRDSDVKEYLNGEFLKKLKENGMKDDDIVPLSIDLKCTLGQREYGFDVVHAGLMTLEQYGKYYPIIKKADSWWLATPVKTPNRSIPAFDNPGGVYYVWSDGGYYDNYCGNSYGVRPVLNFSSSLVISENNKKEYLLIAKGSEEEFVERYPDNAAAEEAMDQKVSSFLKSKNIEPGSELFDEHCYRDCGWFAYTAQEAYQSYWVVKAPKNAFEELKIELELVNTGMDQTNAMPNESVYDACEHHITRIESMLNKLDAEGVFYECKKHKPCGLFDNGWGRN